jgi:predicted dehydrogenase
VGAFGRNHARVYRQLQQEGKSVRFAAVVDANVDRADEVAREFGARAFGSVEQMIRTYGEVQAASVAVPTQDHLAIARTLMQAGIDVLIEKPLAPTLEGAEELIRVAAQEKRIAQVGHLERFNPAVRATQALLTQPMFFEVHRLSPFTSRSLAFAKSPIREIRAVGLPILSGKVDIANVRMEFESGCVANLTASRVSTERVRKLRFFQPGQYFSVDYGRQDVLVFSVGKDGQPSANPQITVTKPQITAEEPLRAEIAAFLEAVATRSQPLVSLEDGRRALSAALRTVAAIAEHGSRAKLDQLGARNTSF